MENRTDDQLKKDPPLANNHTAINIANHKPAPKKRSEDDDIVVFNIGGEIFETLKATIQKDNVSVLSNEELLRQNYRPKAGGYFFDRDPDIFRAVLNYLRTGELHLPSYICGPAAKTELAFWGVPPSKIERCCWTNYNDWNSTLEALKRFDKDRKSSKHILLDNTAVQKDAPVTCWQKWRPKVWRFITRSNSSTSAKVMGIISLFFVFVSIFTFIAETTKPFQYYETYPNASYRKPNISAEPNRTIVDSPSTNASTPTDSINITRADEQYKYVRVLAKHPVIFIIDMVCLAFFTVEYIIRLSTAPRKIKFLFSVLAIVDLLAILPDYVELLVYAFDPELEKDITAVQYISIIRVIRVLRIFRLIRHVPGLWILVYTLRASVSELMLLVWFLVLGILVFSSLIYFVDDRGDFKDIPEGFWWSLITMTTVGYGDMYPKTTIGKIVGSFCAISGVLVIGFTVPALVNNFMLYYRHVQFAVQLEAQCELERQEKEEEVGNQMENNLAFVSKLATLEVNSQKGEKESQPLMWAKNNEHISTSL